MRTLPSLLLLVLAGLLYLQWQVAPVTGPEPAAVTPAQTDPEPPLAQPGDFAIALDDIESYAIIEQHPLFTPDRQPVDSDEPAAEETVDKGDLATLDYTAAVITPAGKVALLRDAKSGEYLRLSPGGKVKGWTVKGIEEEALVLESEGKEVKMALREFKAPAPVPARARVPSDTPKPRPPVRRPVRRVPNQAIRKRAQE